MSEKLKPCPICGGEAGRDHRYAWCVVPGCGMSLAGISPATWQALPRVDIDAIREVVGELRGSADFMRSEHADLDPHKVAGALDEWASRLESLADKGAR